MQGRDEMTGQMVRGMQAAASRGAVAMDAPLFPDAPHTLLKSKERSAPPVNRPTQTRRTMRSTPELDWKGGTPPQMPQLYRTSSTSRDDIMIQAFGKGPVN